jgi:tetratricopeptide (TPR) repeat protein
VETTLIKKGFLEAWTTAAQEFNQAVSDGQRVSIIELKEAWQSYAAVSLKSPPKEWKINNLKAAVASEQQKVKEEVNASWEKAIALLQGKQKRTPEEQNRMGILYARSGNYQMAENSLRKLTKLQNSPKTQNNYACAVILSGDENKALKILEKVFRQEKLPGVAVNRALSHYLKAQNDKDMEGFISALREAKEVLPAGVDLDKYLGIDLAEAGETRAAGEHEKAKKQTLDRRRLKELIRKKVLSKDYKKVDKPSKKGTTKLVHFGGVRGADPEQIAQIVDLLYWFDI